MCGWTCSEKTFVAALANFLSRMRRWLDGQESMSGGMGSMSQATVNLI